MSRSLLMHPGGANWWQQHKAVRAQFANLSVWYLDYWQLAQLSDLPIVP